MPTREEIMLARCQVLVIAMLGKDNAPNWWASRNKAFDMQTPEDVWKTEPEKIYNYLMGEAGR